MVLPVGEGIAWTVQLPERPRLDFGLWVDIAEQAAHDVVTEMLVEVAAAEQTPEPIFRRTIRSGDHWRYPALALGTEPLERFHVPLHQFANQRVTLTFRSRQLLPDTPVPLRVVWGNPLIKAGKRTELPNIVLICMDTLRHDRVFSNSESTLTPALTELARDGVLFPNAVSHSPWTLPSVVSALTGLPPSLHGAGNLLGSLDEPEDAVRLQKTLEKVGEKTEIWRNSGMSLVYTMLNEAVPVLPEYLADTHESYFANSKNGWLKAANLHHRFDASHFFTGDDVRAARLGTFWIDQRLDSRFLVYYHLMYAHEWPQTFLRPDIDPVLGRHVYDVGVALGDQTVGDILDDLRERNLYEDALIVFWSDHGEHLWDPGWEGIQGHGNTLSQRLLRVPLILKFPRNRHAGERVDALVRLRDIFETVLAEVGISAEPRGPSDQRFRALNLAEVIEGSRKVSQVFSEFGSYQKDLRGVQRGRYRLIQEGDGGYGLLDVLEDRMLSEPLNESQQRELENLVQALEAYVQYADQRAVEPRGLELNEEDVGILKALGYLN